MIFLFGWKEKRNEFLIRKTTLVSLGIHPIYGQWVLAGTWVYNDMSVVIKYSWSWLATAFFPPFNFLSQFRCRFMSSRGRSRNSRGRSPGPAIATRTPRTRSKTSRSTSRVRYLSGPPPACMCLLSVIEEKEWTISITHVCSLILILSSHLSGLQKNIHKDQSVYLHKQSINPR